MLSRFLPRALSFVTSVFNGILFISHNFPAQLTLQIFLKESQYVLHIGTFYRYIQEDKNMSIFDIFSDLCRNGRLSKTD